MARTAKRNPWLVGGPPLIEDTVLATDARTWKAGEFGYMSSGAAEILATDGVKVQFQFLQDQTTATSTSKVKVGRITVDHIFEGYVSTDDADVAATSAAVGNDYGIHVGSNYHTVNTNETVAPAVMVIDYAAKYDPYKDTTSTSPGRVTFRFKQSVLDAT